MKYVFHLIILILAMVILSPMVWGINLIQSVMYDGFGSSPPPIFIVEHCRDVKVGANPYKFDNIKQDSLIIPAFGAGNTIHYITYLTPEASTLSENANYHGRAAHLTDKTVSVPAHADNV